MPKYLPKLREVEAYPLKPLLYWDYSIYPDWVRHMLDTDDITMYRYHLHIHTCEGVKTVDYNGYIFKDEDDLVYAMDKDDFENKYEIIREGGNI